ncbi:hypothetical protein M231_06184 [Tremella mesenterica]|uniref:Uncharacterized protein n=1 Tax=Tremella mesenterica TaxID=5217 RepID=A0A4Q1BFD8_TREME|nr:hypothetical protein M231_06184 [Tremella mesenterica]
MAMTIPFKVYIILSATPFNSGVILAFDDCRSPPPPLDFTTLTLSLSCFSNPNIHCCTRSDASLLTVIGIVKTIWLALSIPTQKYLSLIIPGLNGPVISTPTPLPSPFNIGASLFLGIRVILACIQAGRLSVKNGSFLLNLAVETPSMSFSTNLGFESSSSLVSPIPRAVIDFPEAKPNILGSINL